MMDGRDIGIVVQGDVRENTVDVLRDVRRLFPRSQIILSTFEDAALAGALPVARGLVDEVILNVDPGALPPTVRSATAPVNNVNRQLATTRAGLDALTAPYALKLRSDSSLSSTAIVRAWTEHEGGEVDRMVVSSLYTRHPGGMSGYLFHVSDWVCFGAIGTLRHFWAASFMPMSSATWFDTHPHSVSSTAIARRFRARLTPEQWICTQYARSQGFMVPDALDQRTPELVASYESFLARHCLVLEPRQMGLYVPAHAASERSLFQRLDCVSHADWREILWASDRGVRPKANQLRTAARLARAPIARGVLVAKSLRARRGRTIERSTENLVT